MKIVKHLFFNQPFLNFYTHRHNYTKKCLEFFSGWLYLKPKTSQRQCAKYLKFHLTHRSNFKEISYCWQKLWKIQYLVQIACWSRSVKWTVTLVDSKIFQKPCFRLNVYIFGYILSVQTWNVYFYSKLRYISPHFGRQDLEKIATKVKL